MKILQINCVYGSGSTGKITQIIHKGLLNHGVDSLVVYGRGRNVQEKGIFRVCGNVYGKYNNLVSRITGVPYGGCGISTQKILRMIRRERPDVVHVQCINGYFVNIYKLISWLKEKKIPTVVTLHAEFMFTANCGHAFDCEKWRDGCGDCPNVKQATKSLLFDRTRESFQRMQKAFAGEDWNLEIVSVSPWLMERAKQSPVLESKYHRVIFNGVDTAVFRKRENYEIVKKYCENGKKIVFHASAMFRDLKEDPKGGYYILELAERLKDVPVVFLVAGKYDIHQAVPDNVVLLGEIQKQEQLAEYYSMADVTVITSKRETYSMVCAESLCCGTPVVGFRAGGPETIAIPEYSCFIENGNMDELEKCVCKWLDIKERCNSKEIEEEAKKLYAEEIMVKNYEEEYRRLKWNWNRSN